MQSDKYPYSWLWPRLLDLVVFFFALCLVFFIGYAFLASTEVNSIIVSIVGVVVAFIGVFMPHRQKLYYESNPINAALEASLLSGQPQIPSLIRVARLRYKIYSRYILIMCCGLLITIYGLILDAR